MFQLFQVPTLYENHNKTKSELIWLMIFSATMQHSYYKQINVVGRHGMEERERDSSVDCDM